MLSDVYSASHHLTNQRKFTINELELLQHESAAIGSTTKPNGTVFDAPPGQGKSSMALEREKRTANNQPNIYFVERVSEIGRYIAECVHLETPVKSLQCETLTESLLALLKRGKSIVTSHALLSNMTVEHWYEVAKHGYKYVIDEAITEVRKVLEVRSSDIEKLIDDGYLEVIEIGEYSYVKVTKKEGYEKHQKLLKLIQTGQTKLQGESSKKGRDCTYVLVWGIHPETFLSARAIEILTYQSEGSFLHKYLEMLGIEIKKMSVVNSEIVPYRYQDGAAYRKLITVHNGKQNDFAVTRGDRLDSGLTSTWYGKGKDKQSKKRRKKVQSALLSVYREWRRKFGCNQETFAFTCPEKAKLDVVYKEFYGVKLHKKHQAFKAQSRKSEPDYDVRKVTSIPQNTRGVNEYKHKQFMAYMCNTYPLQPIQAAFAQEGLPVDNGDYALNQLIQWLFRGCVRASQPMTVFIPNRRMRHLFLRWLGYSDEELF